MDFFLAFIFFPKKVVTLQLDMEIAEITTTRVKDPAEFTLPKYRKI